MFQSITTDLSLCLGIEQTRENNSDFLPLF
nr:MAG TPA: hypothetical protein [Caudoviricetes sp.]